MIFGRWHSVVAVYMASQRCTESLAQSCLFFFPPFFSHLFPPSDVSQQSLLHLNIGQVDSHWFPQTRSNGSLCRVRNRKITKEKNIKGPLSPTPSDLAPQMYGPRIYKEEVASANIRQDGQLTYSGFDKHLLQYRRFVNTKQCFYLLKSFEKLPVLAGGTDSETCLKIRAKTIVTFSPIVLASLFLVGFFFPPTFRLLFLRGVFCSKMPLFEMTSAARCPFPSKHVG